LGTVGRPWLGLELGSGLQYSGPYPWLGFGYSGPHPWLGLGYSYSGRHAPLGRVGLAADRIECAHLARGRCTARGLGLEQPRGCMYAPVYAYVKSVHDCAFTMCVWAKRYARVACICACACACACACGRGAPLVPPLTLGEASRTFPPSMPSIGSASSWSENCIGIWLGLGLRLALGTV